MVWFTSAVSALVGSVTSALTIGAIGWFFREPLTRWLLGKLEHTRNKEMERLRAAIESSRAETSFVRDYVAGGLGKIAELRANKEFEAAIGLWSIVEENRRYLFLIEMLKTLNIEEINNNIEKDARVQDFVGTIADASLKDDFKNFKGGLQHRLFVSPLAWALFSAYQAVIGHAIIYWSAWKMRLPAKGATKNDELVKMIKAALPAYESYLDQYGLTGVYYIVGQLEDALLQELQNSIGDRHANENSSERVRAILKLSREIATEAAERSPRNH